MSSQNPIAAPELPTEWRHLLDTAFEAAHAAASIQRTHFGAHSLQVETKSDLTPVTVADRDSENAIRAVLRKRTPHLGIHGEEFGGEGSSSDRWIIDPIDGTKNFIAGVPYYATLIGLMLDDSLVMGIVHAPSLPVEAEFGDTECEGLGETTDLGRTWWAVQGHGAYTGRGTRFDRASQRRLQVSSQAELARAFVCHGGLAHFRNNRWEPFVDLVDRCWRTRGFGDWWGHMLVAEGKCDAMIEPIVHLYDLAAVKPIVEEAGGRFSVPDGERLVDSFESGTISSNSALHDEVREVMRFESTRG